jgi:hypothetical protein
VRVLAFRPAVDVSCFGMSRATKVASFRRS